jgi:hypothetical protein
MQLGLIDHRAGEQGFAGVESSDGQTSKPAGPLATQVAFEPDLIDRWLTGISF